MRLEDLQPNVAVRGILPEALVTIVSVHWYGENALELTYKDPAGRLSNEVLYRADEARLQVAEKSKPLAVLWVNGQSTARGMNDVMSIDVADTLDSSLRLIRVPKLEISVFTYWNKKRVQGRFKHAGTDYWLWVTDPAYEARFLAGPEGDFLIGDSYLTISVGEPFKEKNACYKLIAAIIERAQGGAA